MHRSSFSIVSENVPSSPSSVLLHPNPSTRGHVWRGHHLAPAHHLEEEEE